MTPSEPEAPSGDGSPSGIEAPSGDEVPSGVEALPEPEAPRRLHPLSPVLDLFDRNVLAPGVVALGSGGLRILLAAALVLLVFRVLAWSRRTYHLDDGVLRMRSGVLSRNEQLVPCDRIQQVSVVQKLRHRLLGVASLRVEVAGGGRGSGTELDVLGLEEAGALRSALLAAKVDAGSVAGGPADDDPGSRWVPTAWPVVRLATRELVIAGLTGSELFVFFAFLVSASQVFGDVADRLPAVDGADLPVSGPLVVFALVALFVIVWLGSAVAASVLRDAGYTLDLVGDELHLSRGLLDRREAVLPLARVQAVQVVASPLRRPLGYVSLRVQSASAGTDAEDRRVSIPILPVSQLPVVLDLLLPGSASLPPLVPAPRVAKRRAVVRAVGVVAPVVVALVVLTAPVGLLALGLVPLAAAFGVATYRGLGHAVGPVHLVARSGALVRRTVVVPLVRGQSTRVKASPFQRRLGLSTCVVDIAGPGRRPAVVDVGSTTADEVARSVVAAVERPVASRS